MEKDPPMVEIPYEPDHNIVYAGLEFAAEYQKVANETENKRAKGGRG
jgi:hypothetical protein